MPVDKHPPAEGLRVAVIIAAAGRGLRMGSPVPKQLLAVGGRSLVARSIEAFADESRVREVIVVAPIEHAAALAGQIAALRAVGVKVVPGGARRQDSVAAGLRALSLQPDVVLVHDAVRPFPSRALIARTIDAAARHGAAIPAMRSSDTVKQARSDAEGLVVVATLPREQIFLAQTPQGFSYEILQHAVALGESGVEATDEAGLAEMAGHHVWLVEGDPRNVKVTTTTDLAVAEVLAATEGNAGWVGRRAQPMGTAAAGGGTAAMTRLRVGLGYDSHRLAPGRRLVLAGVDIPFDKGLVGHSDADAVAHAVTDAVLGASALGDIGQLFPDSEARWKDADSLQLLAEAATLARDAGFSVINVDVTVVLERPKLAPHRLHMCANLARAVSVPTDAVSIKAKTNEGMDDTGRGDGLIVHAVALLEQTVRAPREQP